MLTRCFFCGKNKLELNRFIQGCHFRKLRFFRVNSFSTIFIVIEFKRTCQRNSLHRQRHVFHLGKVFAVGCNLKLIRERNIRSSLYIKNEIIIKIKDIKYGTRKHDTIGSYAKGVIYLISLYKQPLYTSNHTGVRGEAIHISQCSQMTVGRWRSLDIHVNLMGKCLLISGILNCRDSIEDCTPHNRQRRRRYPISTFYGASLEEEMAKQHFGNETVCYMIRSSRNGTLNGNLMSPDAIMSNNSHTGSIFRHNTIKICCAASTTRSKITKIIIVRGKLLLREYLSAYLFRRVIE